MTMDSITEEQARNRLINALANNHAESLRNDFVSLVDLLRDGFEGYSNMTASDLIKRTLDANLADSNDETLQAIVMLGNHDPEVADWLGVTRDDLAAASPKMRSAVRHRYFVESLLV